MSALVNLKDYEREAERWLPKAVYDWYAGGAGDEISLRENEQAWARRRLYPRVLVNVSACNLQTTILGQEVTMPVMTAPCSLNTLAHREGEQGVARAAAGAGIIQVLSTGSGFSLEEVAGSVAGPRWFQLYCFRDPAVTRELIERAEAAGYGALCVTVDSAVEQPRERDIRNGFRALPRDVRLGNLAHLMKAGDDAATRSQYTECDPGLTWSVLEWIRSITRLPIVVKGVLAPEDARLAIAHGVSGIVVSNHGARVLDTVVSTCDALRRVTDAVSGRAEIFVDGGIRRGSDVLKALALGARAVLIGRPYLWGLAVDGEAGVTRVLEILREELRISLALAGCPGVSEVGMKLLA